MKTIMYEVTEKILKDHLLDFLEKFDYSTFAQINEYTSKNFHVSLTFETLGQIYVIHQEYRTQPKTLCLRALEKQEFWENVESLFMDGIKQDLVEFIYEQYVKTHKINE